MSTEMVMPQMGESITEATIIKWRKAVGDSVKKDEVILEISTDKVDSEIPAPASGVITEILFNEGDVVPVKVKIATIAASGSAEPAPTKDAAKNGHAAPAATKAAAQPTTVEATPQPAVAATPAPSSDSTKFYSPLVKGLAEKHGVSLKELDSVSGSGQGGRLTKEDFMKYVETRGSTTPAPQSEAPKQQRAPTPPAPTAPAMNWGADGTQVVTMDGMRSAIAEHMVRSKQTSPHVYSIQEIDMTNVANWRAKNKSTFEKQEGFSLSFTPFFLEAAVKALQQFPYANASVDGKKIILKKHVNLGCAVALGTTGLIVPVIKHAEEKNLVGLARSLNDLASRARIKKLVPDDVAGGTFTVTNVGSFGTIIGTPIINQPQVAILCLGAIKKRPVVIDDMIAIRQMVYLTLSYDHRIVDGSVGGGFLAFVREYLEGWDMDRPLY